MKAITILITISLLTLPAFAGKTLTNTDLKQYKRTGEEESTSPQKTFRTKEPSLSEKLDKISEEHDQDYWCRWGNYYKGRADNAREKYKEAKAKLRSYSMMVPEAPAYRRAEREVKRTKERLDDTEKDLRNFEYRAYRQSVPASWYRCQYE